MYDPTMRVLTVLELLQSQAQVTVAQLAARLEVHPRTVQRYVARLQDLGVPVRSTRGLGAAYSLQPGFRLPPMMFSDDEALALMLSLQTLRHLGLSALAPATERANAKLQRALPKALSERVQSLQHAIEVDVPPAKAAADLSKVLELAGAVQSREVLSIRYISGDTITEREVEPYGVVHHEGRWYLVAHCRLRGDTRSFRADRIVASQALVPSQSFEPPVGFSARAFLHQSMPFAPAPWQIELWIGLAPDAAAQSIPYARAILEPSGAGTRVRCGVTDLDWFAATVLSLNCAVEVAHPPELLEAFKAVALRAQWIAQRGAISHA